MHTCCSTNQHFSYHCYSICQGVRIRRTGARDLSLHPPRLHNAVALTWMLDISSVAPWRCKTGSVRSRLRTYRFGRSFTSFIFIFYIIYMIFKSELKRGNAVSDRTEKTEGRHTELLKNSNNEAYEANKNKSTCTHTHTHTRACMHTHSLCLTHTHEYADTYTHTHTYACMHPCIHTHTHTYTSMYIYMHHSFLEGAKTFFVGVQEVSTKMCTDWKKKHSKY